MYHFIDEIDDQPYMREDFVLNKLIQACKYLYREEYERMSSKQRIFDNIEHLKHECNLNVEIPKDIPEDCNVICWESSNKNAKVFYKEDEELYYWSLSIKDWCPVGNISIEQEVSDDVQNGYDYVYLRLATKDNSDVFTPERLLGVETDKGFIIGVLISNAFADYIKPSYYVYTSESPYKLEDIHKVKFYISDDSDETVSFEEYVRMFYEE